MKIKKLYEHSIIPTRSTEDAAGLDLYMTYPDADNINPVYIAPGSCKKIGTGVALALEPGTAALILPRSGLATKEGLRPSNTPGLIDADYRGQVIVALYNDSDKVQAVYPGTRIAQMVIIPYITTPFEVVDELDETERGDGGFGSSGK